MAGDNTFIGEDPSWTPDKRHVTLTMDNAIYVIDTWLDAKRRLVFGKGTFGQSNWSPILNPAYDIYVVQKGATLSVIAMACGVTVDDIKKANNLNSDVLQPGQRLVIPQKSTDSIEPPKDLYEQRFVRSRARSASSRSPARECLPTCKAVGTLETRQRVQTSTVCNGLRCGFLSVQAKNGLKTGRAWDTLCTGGGGW
ncbi:MAG: LysM peptidoglycan-binding domain-containing protein [Lentisphaeria bacterium]|nr:LysM peptidoglycan-binding domain-containing protein [Lentisphaeria bacterium]